MYTGYKIEKWKSAGTWVVGEPTGGLGAPRAATGNLASFIDSSYPFSSWRVHMASLSKNFDFNIRRDHQKIPTSVATMSL